MGNYAVVVPTGVFNVKFEPPGFSLPLGSDVHPGFPIFGTTTLNGVLSPCPFATNYGSGLAGTSGIVPHITSTGGAPRAGSTNWGFRLEDGIGGGVGLLLASFGPASAPFFGGTLLVNPAPPAFFVPIVLGGAPGMPGAGTLTLPIPDTTSLVGITGYAQSGVFDFAAPRNLALSEGLEAAFCP